MKKTISLDESVYEICSKYPEAAEILAQLGFRDVTKPGILNTVGKLVTIPHGAAMRGLDLSAVTAALQDHGFEIEGAVPAENSEKAASGGAAADEEDRTALLRDYVSRLSRGESLEDVRKDFVAHFQSVDAAEIANAEQELIANGTPVAEVQRLCDVHSALFHGATREEQIANAEKAVQASAENEDGAAAALLQIPGHPLGAFAAENRLIAGLIAETRACAASGTERSAVLEKLSALHAAAVHYAKKGDLLYPLLKSNYGVSGPADVMWGVDVEIKNELRVLAAPDKTPPDFEERLGRLLTRAEEMIYKENNILFPLCARHFTQDDWMRIYYELASYDSLLPGKRPVWDDAEAKRAELKSAGADARQGGGRIALNSGHMTPRQIEAVLNTIPMELTFIDGEDRNCFFNDGGGKRLFKRPDAAVDREVYDCHPPKYAAMARSIISSLKSGARDSADVWLTKRGEPVLVRYMAVRGRNGDYVGTLECVQKMGFAKTHFNASAAERPRKEPSI
jgi:DUF438 domain-containing protein